MRLALLTSILFLSSCASPSPLAPTHAPPPPTGTPGLAVAQTLAAYDVAQAAQGVAAAQTQQAIAHTAQARQEYVLEVAIRAGVAATEARQMTVEAISDRERADALLAQQDARRATLQAAATISALENSKASHAATIEAARAIDAATAVREAERMQATEAAKREENITAIQTGNAILPGLWGLLGVATVAVIVAIAGYWLFGVARASVRRRYLYSDSKGGLVVLSIGADGQMAAAPVFPRLTHDTAHEPPRRLPPATPSRINPRVLSEYRQPEGANRRGEVIDLLRAAQRYHEENSGDGKRIPRYSAMPDYASRTEAWMKATGILEAAGLVYIVANQGPQKSGTFMCGQWTVQALLSRVEEGSVSLQPVNVAENVTKRAEITIERSELAEGVAG